MEKTMTNTTSPAAKPGAWLSKCLLGTSLLLANTTLSFAQSYDPDPGQGNTAPPGITYGGGLRYGSGAFNHLPDVWSHRAEFRHHRLDRRHHRAR